VFLLTIALSILRSLLMPTIEELTNILDDKKAEAIVALDVHDLTSICDTMIIATATSPPHLAALADTTTTFAKKNNIEVLGVEGLSEREWVLVDLGNILVHLMLKDTRNYYELEKLWAK